MVKDKAPPLDRIGCPITTTKFNSPNFIYWSNAIKMFLMSRDKLYYIDKDAKWIKEDAQVRSWLWNNMKVNNSANFILFDTV